MTNPKQPPILVSACLAGFRCRYDGKDNFDAETVELVRQGRAIPVCPEQLGDLPTPRVPVEIKNSKAMGKDGKNYTKSFQKGAKEVLRIAKCHGCHTAILKERSPSCGVNEIYDGTFSGKTIKGKGFLAKLLSENDIEINSR